MNNEGKFKLDFIKKTMHNMQPYENVKICKLCQSLYPMWTSICPYCQPIEYMTI